MQQMTSTSSSVSPAISRTMIVHEIITLYPAAVDVMAAYGIHCFSCALGGIETLEEGCKIHGFEDEVIDQMIDDMNEAVAQAPAKPAFIEVTEEAAKGIAAIAKENDCEGQGLEVVVDENGGFCMEFREEKQEQDLSFSCKTVPEIEVFVSLQTLQRIGGATIDMRDGRFKLDLDDEKEHCGGCGDGCACVNE